MNATTLYKIIAKKTNISESQARDVMNVIYEEIRKSLEKGESVQMRGLGTFFMKKKKGRIVRNFKKNEGFRMPGGYYPAFRPGKDIAEIFIKEEEENE